MNINIIIKKKRDGLDAQKVRDVRGIEFERDSVAQDEFGDCLSDDLVEIVLPDLAREGSCHLARKAVACRAHPHAHTRQIATVNKSCMIHRASVEHPKYITYATRERGRN